MARIIRNEVNPHTEIVVLDKPGAGGACHEYHIVGADAVLTSVHFQAGPIQEGAVNGCQNEDLLLIVKDRLEHFQAGPFPCVENQKALAQINNAFEVLNQRTLDRRARGVEGRSAE